MPYPPSPAFSMRRIRRRVGLRGISPGSILPDGWPAVSFVADPIQWLRPLDQARQPAPMQKHREANPRRRLAGQPHKPCIGLAPNQRVAPGQHPLRSECRQPCGGHVYSRTPHGKASLARTEESLP